VPVSGADVRSPHADALDRARAALTELGENDAAGLAFLLVEFDRKGRGTGAGDAG